MKIKNEFVKLKTKNREITLKNLILNNYLSIFAKCQYNEFSAQYYGSGNKHMSRCFLKLDTPLEQEIKPDMFIYENSFDIFLEQPSITQNGNANNVSILYGFSNKYGYYDIEKGTWVHDYKLLGERKITAIAFGNTSDIFAILDTSSYDLKIPEDSLLNVSRKDNFSTDALLNGADFPLHLAPIGIREVKLFGDQAMYVYEYGILYSVGLSGAPNIMQEEYILGEDVEIVPVDDYSFKFALIKSTENTKYPQSSYQPSSTKYPVRFNTLLEKHPETSYYPSSNKYPLQSDYKYIILKFRRYYIHGTLGTFVWTGKEYTMSIYTEKKGLFEVITRIERGDD